MRVLDLFSGIGGFALAAHSVGFTTVAFCEIEPYPTRVLNRHFPGVPVFPDVKELTADALADATSGQSRQPSARNGRADTCGGSEKSGYGIELIVGGFPCQDISYAGKGAGLDGARSGLFYEVVRLVCEIRPRYLLLENVAGLLTRGLADVLGSLASVGYGFCYGCVRASDVGAPHRRDRIWIVAWPELGGTLDAERGERIVASVRAGLTPFDAEPWTTPIANEAEKRGDHHEGLRGQVVSAWPTPTGRDHKDGGFCANVPINALLGRAVWPTPSSGGETDGPHGIVGGTAHRQMLVDAGLDEATVCGMAGGSLNPAWVETLMGYPIGYTLPEGEPMSELPGVWPTTSPDGRGWMTPKGQDGEWGKPRCSNRPKEMSTHLATQVDCWPAGLGAPQHDWEPPRLTTVKENRAHRLKALGNSIVPAVARLWLAAIVQEDAR